MNAPDRFESFIVPDGVAKVSLVKDTKIPNAATITIQREDHTLANLLRYQLLKSKKVLFAGYRIPHPLQYVVEIKIQTTPDSSPAKELKSAMEHCIAQTATVAQAFDNELTRAGISLQSRPQVYSSAAAAGYATPAYNPMTPGYGLGRE